MIALLKACLVDGYGSKLAAGWTMPFANVDETKASFRNDSIIGTGMFLLVDNTLAATNDVRVTPYEVMTDIDNGSFPFCTVNAHFHWPSSHATTTARPWMIIADDRIAYILNYTSYTIPLAAVTTYNTQATVFGDIISLHDPDPYGCVFIGNAASSVTSYMLHQNEHTVAITSSHYYARNIEGDVKNTTFAKNNGSGPSGVVMGQYGAPFGDGHATMITRPTLSGGETYSIRGYLPGMWCPCHTYPYENFEIVEIDSKTFMAIDIYSYSIKGQFLMDIGETFRP